MKAPESSTTKDLKLRWEHLHGKKSTILTDSEKYAKYTLAYIFPPVSSNTQSEYIQASDPIGAQAVNNLSNKVSTTLFPPNMSFFRLHLDSDMKDQIEKSVAMAGGDDPDAIKAKVAALMQQIEAELAKAENKAIEYLDMVSYRPQVVHATKLIIITGNALEFHPPGKPVQVYTLRDYCVVRDLSGNVIEIMTRECKAFETFDPKVQNMIRVNGAAMANTKQYNDKDDVTIYTRIRLENDGKFHVTQSADNVLLDTDGATWPAATLPWVPLAWNLVRGEDYGRGLVAEYAGAFHAIEVLTNALYNIAAIMGDIKFLVNPASNLDVAALNQSQPGSYHSGKEGDIFPVVYDGQAQGQFLVTMIERSERQISQAFLLSSGTTRNAERVTAEEIRMQVDELEGSNGGVYARLASQWQVPVSYIALDQSHFTGLKNGIKPKIVTGMDSLSRTGELDRLRLFMQDLSMLNSVPEDVRATIKSNKFMQLLGTNRQVDYQSFVKTDAELAAEQQQAMQQQAQLTQQDAAGKVAVAAGTAAANTPQQ